LISRFFNHTRRLGTIVARRCAAARLTFLAGRTLLTFELAQQSANRSDVMTFVGRLSVVTAYLAMAFVGAIVLGVI
jgi:hypothetical protein